MWFEVWEWIGSAGQIINGLVECFGREIDLNCVNIESKLGDC